MRSRTTAQAVLGVAVVAARAAAVAWSGPVSMPDTVRYRDPSDSLAPFAVWDGNGPGVLVQAVYLLPAHAAVIVQTVVAAACWAAAACYLAAGVRSSRWSWACWAAVTAAGLSPWFLLWDAWLITEAVTCGGVALGAVGAVAWRRGRAGGALLTVVGLGLAVLARPPVGVLVVPVLVLLLWTPGAGRRVAGAGAAALVAFLGGFSIWQLAALDHASSLPYAGLPHPESLRTIQATDRLAGRGDVPGYLDLARSEGMPECPEADAVVLAPDSVFDKVADLRGIEDCPELDHWLEDGGLAWSTEFTDNTSATFAELVDPAYWLEDSFAGYVYADARLTDVRELARARWPTAVRVVNAGMLAGVLLALVMGLLRARGDRLALLLATAWTAVAFVSAWALDGMEYWRHVLPVFPLLGLLGLAAVALPAGQRPAAAGGASSDPNVTR